MTADTDARLVARTRAGDRFAAGLLAERYLRGCRAIALAILGEVADAEDVCQDAFVAAIERIDDCRDPSRFGPWLFQIVRNRAKDHYRAGSARGNVQLADETHAPDNASGPARMAELSELRSRLIDALFELPEDRREVVLLHDLEGWTHREIAERMGLPPGTVRSHLHHARARLRTLLSPLKE